MRPCTSCGAPVRNNIAICDDCENDLPARETEDKESQKRKVEQEALESEESRQVLKFVAWSFLIFVILLPAVGYFLGGPVIAIVFGFLGLLVFMGLEQLTH